MNKHYTKEKDACGMPNAHHTQILEILEKVILSNKILYLDIVKIARIIQIFVFENKMGETFKEFRLSTREMYL